MFASYSSSVMCFIIVALLTAALSFVQGRARRARLPYPPGPRPRLIIGNLLDAPQVKPWNVYMQWGQVYGDIMHFSILGQHFIVINSEEIVQDLFEKRSKIYSSKPMPPMVELMEWDWNIGLMPYGDVWRLHRRVFHDAFRPKAVTAYQPIQMSNVHEMLRKFLAKPESLASHIRHLAAGIVMKTVYGHDIADENDYFVDVAEKAVGMLSDTSNPGSVLVNIVPPLRYLPTWFPGAHFQRYALACSKLTHDMRHVPWDFVKKQSATGIASPSIAADLHEKLASADQYFADEDTCRNVAGIAYAAGSDTVVSSLSTAILAMAMNPKAVAKAHAEIDSVIGTQRLPTWEDRASLPYVEAFYREVMRWYPAAPLGVPHSTTEDDVYGSYFIPKGTTVIANIYAMTHNAKKFIDADSFMPDRYITSDGRLNDDDTILTFGHGRRICAGRYFADATMWAAIVSVLAVFNITPSKSKDGKYINVEPHYTDGLISHPLPFACSITPRSGASERLISQTASAE